MLLFVKIKPNQRFEGIERSAQGWQIRIHAPATEGKANTRFVEFLAGKLELPKSKIRIRKGLRAVNKLLEIDADEEFVLRRLQENAGN